MSSLSVSISYLQLAMLKQFGSEAGWGFPLRSLTMEGQISTDMARALCRDLAAKGFVEHLTGLWREDGGGPVGSGYGITEEGIAFRARKRREAGLPETEDVAF
jgi:hypothetical protein